MDSHRGLDLDLDKHEIDHGSASTSSSPPSPAASRGLDSRTLFQLCLSPPDQEGKRKLNEAAIVRRGTIWKLCKRFLKRRTWKMRYVVLLKPGIFLHLQDESKFDQVLLLQYLDKPNDEASEKVGLKSSITGAGKHVIVASFAGHPKDFTFHGENDKESKGWTTDLEQVSMGEHAERTQDFPFPSSPLHLSLIALIDRDPNSDQHRLQTQLVSLTQKKMFRKVTSLTSICPKSRFSPLTAVVAWMSNPVRLGRYRVPVLRSVLRVFCGIQVDLNSQDGHGQTALHYLAWGSAHLPVAIRFEMMQEIFKTFHDVDCRASLCPSSSSHFTPLEVFLPTAFRLGWPWSWDCIDVKQVMKLFTAVPDVARRTTHRGLHHYVLESPWGVFQQQCLLAHLHELDMDAFARHPAPELPPAFSELQNAMNIESDVGDREVETKDEDAASAVRRQDLQTLGGHERYRAELCLSREHAFVVGSKLANVNSPPVALSNFEMFLRQKVPLLARSVGERLCKLLVSDPELRKLVKSLICHTASTISTSSVTCKRKLDFAIGLQKPRSSVAAGIERFFESLYSCSQFSVEEAIDILRILASRACFEAELATFDSLLSLPRMERQKKLEDLRFSMELQVASDAEAQSQAGFSFVKVYDRFSPSIFALDLSKLKKWLKECVFLQRFNLSQDQQLLLQQIVASPPAPPGHPDEDKTALELIQFFHSELNLSLDSELLRPAIAEKRWACVRFLLRLPRVLDTAMTADETGAKECSAIEAILQHLLLHRSDLKEPTFSQVVLALFINNPCNCQDVFRMQCFMRGVQRFCNPHDFPTLERLTEEVVAAAAPPDTVLLFKCLVSCVSGPLEDGFSRVCGALRLLLPKLCLLGRPNLADVQNILSTTWHLPKPQVAEYMLLSCFYSSTFVACMAALTGCKNQNLILDCIAHSREAANHFSCSTSDAAASAPRRDLEDKADPLVTVHASAEIKEVQAEQEVGRAPSYAQGSAEEENTSSCTAFRSYASKLLLENHGVAVQLLETLLQRTRTCPMQVSDMTAFLRAAKSHLIFSDPAIFDAVRLLKQAKSSNCWSPLTLTEEFSCVCKDLISTHPIGKTLLQGFLQSIEHKGGAVRYIQKVKENLINCVQKHEEKAQTLLTLLVTLAHQLSRDEVVPLLTSFREAKADFNLPNGEGKTALQLSLERGHFHLAARLVVDGGADSTLSMNKDDSPLLLFWNEVLGDPGAIEQTDVKEFAAAVLSQRQLSSLPLLLSELASSLRTALAVHFARLCYFTESLLRDGDMDLRFVFGQVCIVALPKAEARAQAALLKNVRSHIKLDVLPPPQQSVLEQSILDLWSIHKEDFALLRQLDLFWTVGFLALYRDQIKGRYASPYRMYAARTLVSCSNIEPMLKSRDGSSSQTSLDVLMGNVQGSVSKYNSIPLLLEEVFRSICSKPNFFTVEHVTEMLIGLNSCSARDSHLLLEKVRSIFKFPTNQWQGKFKCLDKVLMHASIAGIPPDAIHDCFLKENTDPSLRRVITSAFHLYQQILASTDQDIEHFMRDFQQAAKLHLSQLRDLVVVAPQKPDDQYLVRSFGLLRKIFIEHRKTDQQNPHHTQMLNLLIIALLWREPLAGLRNIVSLTGTGQGKSLIIALLSACFALQNYAVHVIMVTEYLAERDIEEFKPFFDALEVPYGPISAKHVTGVRCGTIRDYINARGQQFRDAFNPIIRGDACELKSMESIGERILIIDEVDALMGDDEAGIIHSSTADLLCGACWIFDVIWNAVEVGDSLIAIECRIKYNNRFSTLGVELQHYLTVLLPAYVNAAQSAKSRYIKDVDYAVVDGHIRIIDRATGNLSCATVSWGGGVHQFLQIKHSLQVTPGSLMMFSISSEEFLKAYSLIVGVTATPGLAIEQQELRTTHSVQYYQVPLFTEPGHMIRHNTEIYTTELQWLAAIIKKAREIADKGTPVLIVVETLKLAGLVKETVQKSCRAGYVIQGLTGIEQPEECKTIIRHAAQVIRGKGCITVGSLVATRGVDFRASDDCVDKAGGMCVLVCSFFDSLRAEIQAEGRTGRQGRKGQVGYILATPHLAEYKLPFSPTTDPNEYLECLRTAREEEIKKQIASRAKQRPLHLIYHKICHEFFGAVQRLRSSGLLRNEDLEQLKVQWCVWYDLFYRVNLEKPNIEQLVLYFKLDDFTKQRVQSVRKEPAALAKVLYDRFHATSVLGNPYRFATVN